eukprot:216579-Hanusia_phi.AAC.1
MISSQQGHFHLPCDPGLTCFLALQCSSTLLSRLLLEALCLGRSPSGPPDGVIFDVRNVAQSLRFDQQSLQDRPNAPLAHGFSSLLALARRCSPATHTFGQWKQVYTDRKVRTYSRHLSFVFRSKIVKNIKKRCFNSWFMFYLDNVQEAYISHLSFMKRHMDVRHELRLIFFSWRNIKVAGARSASHYNF